MNDVRKALVHVKTRLLQWSSARAANDVRRKRLFRLGGEESGRVTSVVRFDAGAGYPLHPHPQGEEIYVLDGVFSDWRGDHKRGTFLLNPEGFEHAPSSVEGCLLFVRLRQYAGEQRPQIAIDTTALEWDERNRKMLSDDKDTPDRQYLQRVKRGESVEFKSGDVEFFVLAGELTDNVEEGDWLRVPDDTPATYTGVADESLLMVKTATLAYAFAPIIS